MTTATLDPIERLTRDLKVAAITLSPNEARYLVDAYYQIQEYRKAAGNQRLALEKSEEPHSVIDWYFRQMDGVEGQIKRALDSWTDGHPVGIWSKSLVGIGPVLSAGLLAHINIEKAPTVGHIWRFAGLDPTVTWNKGEKRPWNADLKVLTWKIGQSFMKFQNNPNDFYGKLYVQRKAFEVERNEAGTMAEQAAAYLAAKKFGHETEAYKAYTDGRLPAGQIDARARRWAVKLFLAHWHEVAYFNRFGVLPPKPYVMEHLGHVHRIEVPNAELVAGLVAARAAAGI